MTPKIERPALWSVMRHSKLVEEYEVAPGFMLQVRPWTPEGVDEIQPLLMRLLGEIRQVYSEFKESMAQKRENNEMTFDLLLNFIQRNAERLQEHIASITHIVYVTLACANPKIKFGETDEEFDFYGEDEFRKEIFLPVIVDIARIIYKQNFEKNLSRASGLIKGRMIEQS